MSLLDGKYEVLKQHQADADRTVFEATAPDGTLLTIEWYDLEPDQEDAFERYRRTLKRLKRTGRTAIYDVTSRPGARYVAWERPSDQAGRGRDPELDELLAAHGFSPEDASILRDQGVARLYGLAFQGGARGFRAAPPTDVSEPEARVAPWLRLPPRVRAWSIAGGLLAAASGMFLLGFERRTNDRIVAIPELTGEAVNAAAQTLHAAGFRVDFVPTSSTEEPGSVLSIEPPPGAELRPGRVVRLSYALPSGQLPATDVPRLVGELYPSGVTAKLERAGLRLGRVARIAADVPPDAVIAQSVEPGVGRSRGDAIDILVSAGPQAERTFLPDLVGMPVEDARYLAGVAGIPADRIQEERVPSSGNPGEVLSQSLAPHRPIGRDEAVLRLIVSEGGGATATLDATPSFVGMDRESVVASLGGRTDVEFAVTEALSLPEGVIDQDPAPGEPRSDRLRLTLNVHPLEIPVPDVRARVREPEWRTLRFEWSIEPGIPEVTAAVYATTLEGDRALVHSERVSGGERVRGSWFTNDPGVITFRLELNGQPYSTPIRVP